MVIGCTHNSECKPHQACVNRACKNACTIDRPCGISATCRPENHRAVCTCLPGTTGNANEECIPGALSNRTCMYVLSVLQ